jgi:hypothetical protein
VKRLLIVVGAASLLVAVVGSPARGADVGITAQILSSRAITTALFTTPIPNVATGNADGVLEVVVDETSVAGDAAWHVQAELCEDATCAASRLVHSNGTDVIPNTALEVLDRAVVYAPVLPALDPDKTSVAGTTDALTAARTLFSVTGQDPGTMYTAAYTSTSTVRLTPPEGTVSGTYTGVLRVTLVE